MAAKTKKKTESKNALVIGNDVSNIVMGVDFSTLKPRECFIHKKGLWMKLLDDDNEQAAVCLTTGMYEENMCGETVVPVYAEIDFDNLD